MSRNPYGSMFLRERSEVNVSELSKAIAVSKFNVEVTILVTKVFNIGCDNGESSLVKNALKG